MTTIHWETTRLSRIAEVRLGRQRSPKRADGPNMRRYVRAANVTWNGISLHDVKEMDFTPSEFEAYALRDGDILLAEASGSASEVGKPAVWAGQVPDCCFQNTLIRVRTHADLVAFLHLHFQKDAVTGAFARASRGVGIHHLGAKALTEWDVQMPPLGEQHRIVSAIESYFTRLDDAVATLERVQRNLKRYRASVLKAAVEGRLVPTEAELARAEGRSYEPASVLLERILAERRRRWEDAELAKMTAKGKTPKDDKWKAKYVEPVAPDTSDLPELPEGWRWTPAETVCPAIVSGSTPIASDLFPDAGPVPFLKVYNLTMTGELDFTNKPTFVSRATHDGQLARSRVRPGDVLMNIVGPPLGKVSVVTNEYSEWNINQAIVAFRPGSGISTGWLRVLLMSEPIQSWLLRTSKTTTSQVNLAVTSCRRVPFPLPPEREQWRIVAEADRLLSVAHEVQADVLRELAKLGRLRQSILKWAFEGRLVDQDPTDEPASVLLERIRAERAAANDKPPRRPRRTKARSPKS